jgi:hypothetical protein
MDFILPDWPAPACIRSLVTARQGGVSLPPFHSFNLGDHVGDAPEAVAENRRRLAEYCGASPFWLKQVHGTQVVALPAEGIPEADASYTTQTGVVCSVLTADCLPVLFCDRAGSVVAATHAGWRGLAAGVLEQTIAALPVPAHTLMAWLGPCIGVDAFEVGPEVRAAFVAQDDSAQCAFVQGQGDRFYADLFTLAQQRLIARGVSVYGRSTCTYGQSERFFSYRKQPTTGRFASLVWIVNDLP